MKSNLVRQKKKSFASKEKSEIIKGITFLTSIAIPLIYLIYLFFSEFDWLVF